MKLPNRSWRSVKASMNLIDYVHQATCEALKQHINANSIMLNRRVKLVQKSYIRFFDNIQEYPPMICGLSAFLTDELPDDIAFSLIESRNPTLSREAEIKYKARQEFIEELKTMNLEDIAKLLDKEAL